MGGNHKKNKAKAEKREAARKAAQKDQKSSVENVKQNFQFVGITTTTSKIEKRELPEPNSLESCPDVTKKSTENLSSTSMGVWEITKQTPTQSEETGRRGRARSNNWRDTPGPDLNKKSSESLPFTSKWGEENRSGPWGNSKQTPTQSEETGQRERARSNNRDQGWRDTPRPDLNKKSSETLPSKSRWDEDTRSGPWGNSKQTPRQSEGSGAWRTGSNNQDQARNKDSGGWVSSDVQERYKNSRSPNRNIDGDKNFAEFLSFLKSSRNREYIKVHEMEGDLFAMPKEYSLAHCVAEDMAMGSGIAVQFSRDFKRRDELLQQRSKQGGLAILEIDQRFIYYLVTKRVSTGKPTLHTLWSSLQKMKQHIQENKVTKLAMPRIGCGLDRLEWSDVKCMIEFTFRDTDIEIMVCNFQQPEDDYATPPARSFKCPVKNVEYPLVDIEQLTAIVYFGSEDGFVTETIESLDTKFNIIQDYKRATRTVGSVYQSIRRQNTYFLYGFIIKKTKNDLFGFTDLQKCVESFKKMNSKDHACSYVGIQAFSDDHDDLIMTKIVNILRHNLRYVDLYVCWPGNMALLMPQNRNRDDY